MKKLSVYILVIILMGVFQEPATADIPTKPVLVSFTMTPDTIDLATSGKTVTFDLTVTNPTGIASSRVFATLSDGGNNTIITPLVRTDLPVKYSLSTVVFHGTVEISANLPSGVYTATANPVLGLNSDGSSGFPSDTAYATTTSKLVGAVCSLLVRTNGYLNYAYPTFIGPTFNNKTGVTFTDSKYIGVPAPIWKVGESFTPTNYYQLLTPNITLKVSASSPNVCTSDGNILKFIGIGACSFSVYTDKNFDYQSYQDLEVVSITPARVKPTYTVGTIATQNSATLPLLLAGPFVYGPLGTVIPVSATPTVCYPAGTYINVISGGTCTLSYSTPESTSYLASDVYQLTFQITRVSQSITFSTPKKVMLSSKSTFLTGSASSNLPLTFQSNTASVCVAEGNLLKFIKSGTCTVEAIQVGSTTVAPTSSIQSIDVTGLPSLPKKVVCVKASVIRVFTGTKCPVGYKARK